MNTRKLDSLADIQRLEQFMPLLLSFKLSNIWPFRKFIPSGIKNAYTDKAISFVYRKIDDPLPLAEDAYYACRMLWNPKLSAEEMRWMVTHVVVLEVLLLRSDLILRDCLSLLHGNLQAVQADFSDNLHEPEVSLAEFLAPLDGVETLELDLCCFTDAASWLTVFLNWCYNRPTVFRLTSLGILIRLPNVLDHLIQGCLTLVKANIAEELRFTVILDGQNAILKEKIHSFICNADLPEYVSVQIF